ncbi:TPA: hypothetical protein ACNOH7_001948 [Vibrio fluvialis]
MASLLSKRIEAVEGVLRQHERRLVQAHDIKHRQRAVQTVKMSFQDHNGNTIAIMELSNQFFKDALAIVEKQEAYSTTRVESIERDLGALEHLFKQM